MKFLWILYLIIALLTGLVGLICLIAVDTVMQEQVVLLIVLTINISLYLGCKAIEATYEARTH